MTLLSNQQDDAKYGVCTYVAIVAPGMCDINGHLNTPFYYQFFDASVYFLLMRLSSDEQESQSLSWADVKQNTEFLKELHPSDEIVIYSAVSKVGNKSLTSKHVLLCRKSRQICAITELVSVRFDKNEGCAVNISSFIKEKAYQNLVLNKID